jgi:hypothetical protein
MDPDAALQTIRAATAIEEWIPGENVDHDHLIEQALEAMKALDEWITQGCFLPSAWSQSC